MRCAKKSHDRLASAIIHELGSTAAETEVGYRLGKRFTVRAIQRPALPRSPVPITRGGTWLVTGGEREELRRISLERWPKNLT